VFQGCTGILYSWLAPTKFHFKHNCSHSKSWSWWYCRTI